MTTTAQYRAEALQAEKELRWADAAMLWGKAINAYPMPTRRAGRQLYRKDMLKMLSRARACVLSANEERNKVAHNNG